MAQAEGRAEENEREKGQKEKEHAERVERLGGRPERARSVQKE